MNYKTAVAFAREVRKVIDDYWKLVSSKEDLIDKVTILFANTENRGLALRGSTFSTTFSKVLGKKRLSVLKETLKVIDAGLYNELV